MSCLHPPTYTIRGPRLAPTTDPPPPHTRPSNLAGQPPPAQYALTSSIPDSSNSFRHHPSDKFHRHNPRCAASCSRLSPPTPPTHHSDQAPPTQSKTTPPYQRQVSKSSHHSPSSKLHPKPPQRNTRTCFSDSPQSTSPAPKPLPDQSTGTSGRQKFRHSIQASSLHLFSPAQTFPVPRSCSHPSSQISYSSAK